MQRSLSILFCSLLVLPVAASAQSVKITLPDTTTCTYATGQVTNNATPGQLQATATATPTGNGCGTTTSTSPVTFGPAAPLSPALMTLQGNTGTVNFSFQALNATSCTGSITGAAGGAFTNGTTLCSGAGCNSPVSAPASFTNSGPATVTYNVAVVCTGAGTPATSTAAIVVPIVNGGGPGCTNPYTITSTTSGIANFTRYTGSPSVYYFGAGSNTADVTSFDSIFQHAWPGNSNLTADISLPTNRYLAAQFKVPAGYIAGYHGQSPLYGDYTLNQSTGSGGTPAAVSMSISTTCGDFSNPDLSDHQHRRAGLLEEQTYGRRPFAVAREYDVCSPRQHNVFPQRDQCRCQRRTAWRRRIGCIDEKCRVFHVMRCSDRQ